MKSLFTSIIGLLVLAFSLNAQTAVSLEISHLLGTETFKTNTLVSDNNGGQIAVNRLEFYISKIKLIHDGGQTTSLDSIYILENASMSKVHQLGTHSITTLEGIKFGLGVDNLLHMNPNDPSSNTTNHADPSLWPMGHALAPKSPSMHWGWSAGYRFVAYEGKAGSLNGFTFEIHALGDQYYYEIDVPVTLTAKDGKINIQIEADHVMALDNIDVSRGLIEHGSTPKAVACLDNYKSKVFSVKDPNTAIEAQHDYEFKLGPNPSQGKLNLFWQPVDGKDYEAKLTDLSGRVISLDKNPTQEVSFSGLTPGIYVVSILENGVTKFSEKVVVTQ